MHRRSAAIAALVIAVCAGCGGGGGGGPVAEDSAPGQVAPKERPDTTVAPRLEDLRPGYLPAGMEERTASADPNETGLLPPVSLGGSEAPSASVTTADAAGSRFAHTWSALPASPDQLARAAMISVVAYPVAAAASDVAAGGGGQWVETGPRRVYVAERPEPDGVSLTASWLEADVVVSAKARNVARAEFLKVIGSLEAP